MSVTLTFPIVHPHLHVYTGDEIRECFESGAPIFFDTMVFRNLWKLHSNPRASLLETIGTLKSRTYLPYQVQVELHRAAYSDAVLSNVPTPGLFRAKGDLESVGKTVLDEIAKVRPQNSSNGVTAQQIKDLQVQIDEKLETFQSWLVEVDEKLRTWLGDQINVSDIRRGKKNHTLLDEVSEVFEEGHLFESPGEEELAKWKELYLARVKQDDPVGPGKSDTNKESTDEAAGDFYVWKEMLEHCAKEGASKGFVFVTEERKPDIWEVQQNDKALRRIDPRIQAEAIEATGGPMHVLTFEEFLNLAVSDETTREILFNISQDAGSTTVSWTSKAYVELLDILMRRNQLGQRNVIIAAAKAGGYLPRAAIAEILGWGDENRYLTRFRMPADRAKADLVENGELGLEASDPLWAVYDGPGEAKGYAVPGAFEEFQLEMDGGGNE